MNDQRMTGREGTNLAQEAALLTNKADGRNGRVLLSAVHEVRIQKDASSLLREVGLKARLWLDSKALA